MQYIIESSCCLCMFYAFYWLVLRATTFFHWNRWYLLLAPLLSFVLPALAIRIERPAPASPVSLPTSPVAPAYTPVAWEAVIEQAQAVPQALTQHLETDTGATYTLGDALSVLYWMGVVLTGLLLAIRLVRLIRLILRCRRSRSGNGFVLAESEQDVPVASFFSIIFWKKSQPTPQEQLIIEHELVHVRQWHSLDVLLMETLAIWQWFNPIVYLYRLSLRAVHEYIADEYVVRQIGDRRYEYAALLVEQSRLQHPPGRMLNTFHSQLKLRLIMLAQHPSSSWKRIRFLMVLPLTGLLLLLFSFRLIEQVPHFQAGIQQIESYARQLAAVEIVAPTLATEPTTASFANPRYILYWGLFQCELLADQQYEGAVEIKPSEFRKSVFSAPRMWDGQKIVDTLTFDIQGAKVQSVRRSMGTEYESNIATLDQEYAQKVQPGDVLILSNIRLAAGVTGSVRILFSEEAPKSKRFNFDYYESPITKKFFKLEGFSWGASVSEQLQRDFFTVDEVLQTLQEKPTVRWRPDAVPEEIQVGIVPEGGPDELLTVIGTLNEVNYRSMIDKTVLPYKHLIQPGICMGLSINTENGMEAKVRLQVVPNDDPRLPLRRDRDGHQLTMSWSTWHDSLANCYLQKLPNAQGQVVHADHVVNKSVARKFVPQKDPTHIPFEQQVDDLIHSIPKFEVDGKPLTGVSFTATHRNVAYQITPSMKELPKALADAVLERRDSPEKVINSITLSNIQCNEGYDLEPLEFAAMIMDFKVLNDPIKAQLQELQSATPSSQMTLSAPVPNPVAYGDVRLQIEVPEACKGKLMVYDPEPWLDYMDTSLQLPKGISTITIPKVGAFRNKGVHFIFVQTEYGVVSQRLVLE